MPLPFLVAGAVVGLGGVFGAAAKSVNRDYKNELNETYKEIEEMMSEASDEFKNIRVKTEFEVDRLNYFRISIYETTLQEFVTAMLKLKHIEMGKYNTELFQNVEKFVAELKDVNHTYKSIGDSTTEHISGAVWGAIIPMGYIVGSLVQGVKLMEEIEKAQAIHSEKKVEIEVMKEVEVKLEILGRRANEIYSVVRSIQGMLNHSINQLNDLIESVGSDYRQFSKQQKERVFITFQLAETVKKIIDTPLQNEEGQVNENLVTYTSESKQKWVSGSDENE